MGEGGEGGLGQGRTLLGWSPRGSHRPSVATRLGRGLGKNGQGRSRGSQLRPDGSPGTERRAVSGSGSPGRGRRSRAGRRRRRGWQRKKEPAGNWWAGIQGRWVGLITIIIICLAGPAGSQANWIAPGPGGGGPPSLWSGWGSERAACPDRCAGPGASGGREGRTHHLQPPESSGSTVGLARESLHLPQGVAGSGAAPALSSVWEGLRLPLLLRSRGRTPSPRGGTGGRAAAVEERTSGRG